MAVGDQILVVVSILEGRKFPKRPRHKIIVETKFDGETLSTDPIDHTESPEFTTELAWELNKKALHQHRLQRTPIKVQCYALDLLTSQKESVGYVILDLRSAQQKPERAQWYPLLSSKYQKLKPEIKLLLCLEDDSQPKAEDKPQPSPPSRQTQQKRNEPSTPVPTSVDSGNLQAVLNDDEGFYQIGPKTVDNKVFVLSVTIGFASNLAKLIPSSFKLSDPRLGGGFYFYYSLLGNDVTNEVFHDLLQPNFPAERASCRINSTFETLKLFLNSHRGLEVHLCSGDQSLGMALVSLQSLLRQEAELVESPAVIEALFKLQPMGTQQEVSPVPDDTAPVVGVSVSLRHEQQGTLPGAGRVSPEKLKVGSTIKTPKKTEPQKVPLKTPPRPQIPRSEKGPNSTGADNAAPNMNGSPSTPPRPSTSTPDKATNHAKQTGDTNGQAVRTPIKNQKSPKRQPKIKQPQPKSSAPATSANHPSASHGEMSPSAEMDTQHFCFSIDLRTISDLDVTAPINCFLRYTYPFFGSSAPVMTSPPVEVSRHMHVLLPKSFCAFDFAASTRLLQETFMGIPLVVEVWHKDPMAGSLLLGTATVTLGHILAVDRAKMLSGGVVGYRQIYSERVPVVTAHDPTRKIGELHVVLGLEDFGPINPQQLLAARNGMQSLSNTTSSIESSQASSAVPLAQPQRIPSHQSASPPAVTDPRATAEYQAAMELELWKEQQQEIFQAQLKEKETLHMKTLAEEWKRRDKERELLVKKKVEEYSKLEEKLKATVVDLEKRERILAANESQALRLKEDFEREHERRLQEVKEAARRMKEDCDHQVEMERGKVRDLEQQKQRMVEQLYAAEKRFQDKENEFISYKESQLTKPEIRLQSELDLLKIEKAELERKLDTANKSKIHYKQQWGRALREVARLKQQEQAIARARLKKQEEELEHMRLRYLAAEEKEVVKSSEKNELDEIKQELLRLKQQEEEKLRQSESMSQNQRSATQRHEKHDPKSQRTNAFGSFDQGQEDIDNRIAKLIEERDTLLQTGVYTTDDRIIVELDRQIREAIASKG